MSERDAGPDARKDAAFEMELDAGLAELFRLAGGRDLPAGLHGRVVRSIEARSGTGGRRPWLRRLGGVALAAIVVLAVTVAALPWLQRSAFPVVASTPTPPPTTPVVDPSGLSQATPTPAASESPSQTDSGEASGGLMVMALGPGDVTLDIPEIGTQKIACGDHMGFTGNGPWPWHVQATSAEGSTSFEVPAGKQLSLVRRPMGWVTAEVPPAAGLFAFCDMSTSGTDAGGRLQWTERVAKVIGTPADATITAAIKSAVDARLQYLRTWVAETPGMTATFVSTVQLRRLPVAANAPTADDTKPYLEQSWLPAGLLAVEVTYDVQVPQANHGPYWTDVLVFDLQDGHRIGIDELFTDPAAGLAALSNRVRTDPALSAYGRDEIWTKGTAPTAANFSMWAPTPAGIEITFASGQVGPSALGMPRTTVPWSEVRSLLKTDSVLRKVMP